jgi:hypothetical protein
MIFTFNRVQTTSTINMVHAGSVSGTGDITILNDDAMIYNCHITKYLSGLPFLER